MENHARAELPGAHGELMLRQRRPKSDARRRCMAVLMLCVAARMERAMRSSLTRTWGRQQGF
ncbi:hypothetical protein E2562_023064 [Oryza meyeriana var. granulata]|uniref:Uncharacterized protein n=1 Tax=Oryza meyeriana var. granulata TaxID=110450 RepID=A0A6G1ENZ5_9ORYZ|nr:hypothetical protein E2562_023064 [Oryza meyeriana var. granulata]